MVANRRDKRVHDPLNRRNGLDFGGEVVFCRRVYRQVSLELTSPITLPSSMSVIARTL